MSLVNLTSHHWRIVDAGEVVVSTTPKELWEQAIKYFEYCDNNPILKRQSVKAGKAAGQTIVDELPRAYNIKALCLHCGIEEEWLRDIRQQKENPYYNVVSRIVYIIYCQQYELAAVGELNPVFTLKALEIDKQEAPTGGVKVTIVGDLPPLSNSENEVLEKLEAENERDEKSDFQKS